MRELRYLVFFFFNDTATTEIYTLSLHDALPICLLERLYARRKRVRELILSARNSGRDPFPNWKVRQDRKSTRLNSSHDQISYAVFCLKKKKLQTCSTIIHTHF